MAEELSGYLDVKVPARVRKRGFTPWKAWNKQWCRVRRDESGIQVQLGSSASNIVFIPPNSTLCRSTSRSRQFAFGVFHHVGQVRRPSLFLAGNSETESQKWMAHIRNLLRPHPHFDLNSQIGSSDFRVSLIDNTHSQAAGLTGFYGVLSVGARHIMLSGSSLDEVTVSWEWSHFHQFHLAAMGRKEDENRICVLHTSSEFCAGPGQIYFFCMQAPKLLQCFLRKGHMHQAFPSPIPLRSGRRLSRSESDLRCYCTAEEVNDGGSQDGYYSPSEFLRRPVLMRSHSGSRDSGVRVSSASDDSTQPIRGKVASSLISAGLGLLFSTPGCSEADTESLHEYQQIGSYDSDEEGEEVGALFRTNSTSTHSPRRESGISLASGIYEEILEDDVLSGACGSNENDSQNHYENPTALGWGKAYEESICPPPLPPRKHNFSLQAKASMSDEALDEKTKSGYRIPSGGVLVLPTPLSLQQGRFQNYSASCSSLPAGAPWDHWPVRRRLLTETETEPDYMPMSPGGTSVIKSAPQHEEQHYMVMASLNSS